MDPDEVFLMWGPQRRAEPEESSHFDLELVVRSAASPTRTERVLQGRQPVTRATPSFAAASLTDERLYPDHLFIKKIVPIMASLCSP